MVGSRVRFAAKEVVVRWCALASADPTGFVRAQAEPVAIDEIQKAPALFPAIKLAVDRDRRPGRFLLTGAANVLALPRLSESLPGAEGEANPLGVLMIALA